jgi:hypothetical protein
MHSRKKRSPDKAEFVTTTLPFTKAASPAFAQPPEDKPELVCSIYSVESAAGQDKIKFVPVAWGCASEE